MHQYLITETSYPCDSPNTHYFLNVPDPGEPGFYREVRSLNAFFFSSRNPRTNVTESRQFTAGDQIEIDIKKKSKFFAIDWDNIPVFKSIGEFFKYISYDPKTRIYKSGERLQIWVDGEGFKIPKKRSPSNGKVQTSSLFKQHPLRKRSVNKPKKPKVNVVKKVHPDVVNWRVNSVGLLSDGCIYLRVAGGALVVSRSQSRIMPFSIEDLTGPSRVSGEPATGPARQILLEVFREIMDKIE